ncbi:MAG: hypothetical protein A2017_12255 [Lentisphaerae bacterium GWF2_44_16]|nr:MAG: hypothetical protein A2017_12255 [Lentisphaerae bacterium GWF2_44_16]
MNKLFILPLLFMASLALMAGGCTMIGAGSNDYHESNSTVATFAVDHEKFDAAILKAAPEAGYEIKETENNLSGGTYEGSGIKVTYRKYKYNGEEHIKAYVRIGYIGGDRKKEKEFIAVIRKELHKLVPTDG